MTLEINAQFKQFVQFAQQQSDGEAIARTAPATAGEGVLAGRAVTAARNDKFGAFNRSVRNKDHNNEARALFRQSVNAIFGGAENLPQGVKEAMKLGDYDNQGKPLTARSILAVHKAILLYKAEVEVDRAAEHLTDLLLSPLFRVYHFRPRELSPAQRRTAARTIAKFARNLSDDGLRLLADYVTIATAGGEVPDAVGKRLRKLFAPDRDLRSGDTRTRLEELELQLRALAQEQLAAELALEKKGQADTDGISGAFDQTSPDDPVTIGDRTLPDGPADAE